ncbi:MAG: hypothetical protein OHK0022_59760 [Roseiflexaceae bacterium]
MSSFSSSPWPDEPPYSRTLERVDQRRTEARRLLGRLAVAIQHDAPALIDTVVGEALGWPEASEPQRQRKAALLYAITAFLARTRHTDMALWLAPLIPLAPGMTQVLVFSTEPPRQSFCWRVTPAYALVDGRAPLTLPLDPLIQPYQRGHVSIDEEYLRRVLLPRRRTPRPILLLPHPRGLVDLGGMAYVILDGNHRVVCAWHQRLQSLPGHILSPEEAAAVLVSHSQWPPYRPGE